MSDIFDIADPGANPFEIAEVHEAILAQGAKAERERIMKDLDAFRKGVSNQRTAFGITCAINRIRNTRKGRGEDE